MSQSANVRSIESIHDFKVALANFADDARNALNGVESDLRKTRNWLQRDQLVYWQSQVKRRNEEVSTARTELHRRRLSQQGSDAVTDTEQRENLRAAQRRLEEAERKVALVKKWVPVLEHAIAEYHTTAQPLGDSLGGSLVNSMMLLQRTVASLEAYLATAPPPAPAPPPDPTTHRDDHAVSAAPTPSSTSTSTSTSTADAPAADVAGRPGAEANDDTSSGVEGS